MMGGNLGRRSTVAENMREHILHQVLQCISGRAVEENRERGIEGRK
jgi:hypothetical protein